MENKVIEENKITEGDLEFIFPERWLVSKFDEWAFYRNQFIQISEGLKALDILAFSPEKTLWLIEVKDYRQHRRTKAIDLSEEVTKKVLFTLAALLPAQANANNLEEKNFAAQVLEAKTLRVVLHLEQPRKPTKLFPKSVDPADVCQRLKRAIKAIDPHPKVVDTQNKTLWNTVRRTCPAA